MLEICHLSYGKILREVSQCLRKGELVVLLGPNGAGKTTLLRCILGSCSSSRGEIRFAGRSLATFSLREKARLLAYIPQSYQPVFPYTVLEFVLLGRTPYLGFFSSPGKRDRIRAREILQKLGLESFEGRRVTELSGGERQRVLLARALLQEARILLLDEPTANLDLQHQVKIMTLIRQMTRERGLTVMATLHDPNLALSFADRVLLIKEGRLLGELNPANPVEIRNHLEELYQVPLEVLSFNGRTLVFPAQIFTSKGNKLLERGNGDEVHKDRSHILGQLCADSGESRRKSPEIWS